MLPLHASLDQRSKPSAIPLYRTLTIHRNLPNILCSTTPYCSLEFNLLATSFIFLAVFLAHLNVICIRHHSRPSFRSGLQVIGLAPPGAAWTANLRSFGRGQRERVPQLKQRKMEASMWMQLKNHEKNRCFSIQHDSTWQKHTKTTLKFLSARLPNRHSWTVLKRPGASKIGVHHRSLQRDATPGDFQRPKNRS